jgi:hypothetical protein
MFISKAEGSVLEKFFKVRGTSLHGGIIPVSGKSS